MQVGKQFGLLRTCLAFAVNSEQQQLWDSPEAIICKEAFVGCQHHQVRIIMPLYVLHMHTDFNLFCYMPLRHKET